ncbi:uhpC [Scenedesmus sp. PABB004]|nr:uhpC [Scenedesmus sp. PABB004]
MLLGRKALPGPVTGRASGRALPGQLARAAAAARSPSASAGWRAVQPRVRTRAAPGGAEPGGSGALPAGWGDAAGPPAGGADGDVAAQLPKAAPSGGGASALSSQDGGLDHPPGFVARRLLVFGGILLGYTCLYLNRGTLTFSAPVMTQDPLLGLTKTDIGAMTSAFPAAYGLSKFLGGMLGAAFSPRLMLALGLIATSAINLAFGFTSGVVWWTAMWAANGGIQGLGAPACAMLLTRWFAASERGLFWGLWNISTNLGGFLSPIIVGFLAKHYGWQWGMMAPGLFGLAAGTVLLFVLADKPEDAGFPPVEAAKAPEPGAKQQSAAAALGESMREVLTSWRTWVLAVVYFFVYLVRQGCTSWLVFYLLEAKGAVDAAAAAITVSGLELGGLVGGTLSGALSDASIKAAKSDPGAGLVGRRVQIVMAYTAACIGMLIVLRGVPAGAATLQWVAIAALGFCIYGPQMLIGLCGAELISPRSVGASQGILGLISYAGAAGAGIPLSFLQARYGWDGYFSALLGACVVSLALLAPLANAKSWAQTQRAAKAA